MPLSLGLDRYATILADNDVDFEALRFLNEKDLQELGISLGHRKRLLRAIAELNGAETSALTPSAEPIRLSHLPSLPRPQAKASAVN